MRTSTIYPPSTSQGVTILLSLRRILESLRLSHLNSSLPFQARSVWFPILMANNEYPGAIAL